MDEIKCPVCGYVEDEYHDFVTYWGDHDVDYECAQCGAKLVVHESVVRMWEVTVREPRAVDES